MILHICGNFAADKTTAAAILRRRLGWPVVPVGRIRAALRGDETGAWIAARRLWRAWDNPDPRPGRSGIWVSTGRNWRELLILSARPPRWLCRAWLTAPPAVLEARYMARWAADGGDRGLPWPFAEDPLDLLRALAAADSGDEPPPWPVDVVCDTHADGPGAVADKILTALAEWAAVRGVALPPAQPEGG